MYAECTFVHWYRSEGMEEAEFSGTQDDKVAKEGDYEADGSDGAEGNSEG